MNVVDHRPHAWYLLRDGEQLFLDVNCSQGAFSFGFLLMLSEQERGEYDVRGREALDELAEAVQYSAPMARDATSSYRHRNLDSLRGGDVFDALRRWRLL